MSIGTITIVDRINLDGGHKLVKCSFDGDDAYPTGGTTAANVEAALKLAIKTAAAAADDANVRAVENLSIVDVIAGDCGQYVPSWTSSKLKVRDGGSATWAEASNEGDLSGTTFNVTFICE